VTEQEVLDYFEKKYPGKTIVMLPEDNPTEIICEIEPSSEHPVFSNDLAFFEIALLFTGTR
jgi:hypothetical protein